VRRALLDYELPPDLIATRPPPERDGARLLVLDAAGALAHAEVRDLDRLALPGTLVVVNDTRVIPARLLGHKVESGGKAELLLVRRLDEASIVHEGRELPAERWTALGRASKPLRPGAHLRFDPGSPDDAAPAPRVRPRLCARILGVDGALLTVHLFSPAGAPVAEALDAVGHVPLPPYLHRADDPADRERYQTVFARVPGAVAAPTAGLHLTPLLLDRLAARGVEIAKVTLHVGLGTFQPVIATDLDDHPMHAEVFSVPAETALAVERARDRGAPVLAVGTTVVRALESAADPDRPGRVRALVGETRLLIQPGYAFRVVDQLLTNFHLPQSTLLALVAAFAGRERVLSAYGAAVAARYRFYSYGDAMLIRARADREAA
jgi:S-adenosylmethionine:tRNA ribosyltransferase-isomerase